MEPIHWQASIVPNSWIPSVYILFLSLVSAGSNQLLIAFFFLFMGLLMVIYCVCATRTNIVLVGIFASLMMHFSLLAAAYWRLGLEDAVTGNRLTVVSSTNYFRYSTQILIEKILGWWCCCIRRCYARVLFVNGANARLCWLPFLLAYWRLEQSLESRIQKVSPVLVFLINGLDSVCIIWQTTKRKPDFATDVTSKT